MRRECEAAALPERGMIVQGLLRLTELIDQVRRVPWLEWFDTPAADPVNRSGLHTRQALARN